MLLGCWWLLSAALLGAGIPLFVYTMETTAVHRNQEFFLAASILTILTLPISLYGISMHLMYYTCPQEQRYAHHGQHRPVSVGTHPSREPAQEEVLVQDFVCRPEDDIYIDSLREMYEVCRPSSAPAQEWAAWSPPGRRPHTMQMPGFARLGTQ